VTHARACLSRAKRAQSAMNRRSERRADWAAQIFGFRKNADLALTLAARPLRLMGRDRNLLPHAVTFSQNKKGAVARPFCFVVGGVGLFLVEKRLLWLSWV
jgi:hypothetical protein